MTSPKEDQQPMTTREELVGHTPGPWDFCKPHKRWLVYPKLALNDGIDYFVAEAINVDGRKQEAKANARLIAAAPDLLAVVKSALRILERDFPNGQLVIDARAAIAAATGGNHEQE